MTETSCPGRPTLLSPWRRRVQWGVTLLLLLIPWLHAGGNSLLRIDIPGLSLYFFGQILRIEELYLVLLFSLLMTLGFLLMTMPIATHRIARAGYLSEARQEEGTVMDELKGKYDPKTCALASPRRLKTRCDR